MKTIYFSFLAFAALTITACNNSGSSNEPAAKEMKKGNHDTSQHTDSAVDKEVKIITATYNHVDAKAAISIKDMVDHYLHIKNALANDNGAEAVSGAKAMEKAISKLDKSLLTAEQKSAYDKNEDKLKTQAQLIAGKNDNIQQQRDHFIQLSEAVYELVKTFGGGRTLYHDHCPMAKDNQGAMWISELKEVKNPYFGAGMPTCGTVEEVIK